MSRERLQSANKQWFTRLIAGICLLWSQFSCAGTYSNQHFQLSIPDSFSWYVSADSAGNSTYSFKDTKRPRYKTAEVTITVATYGNALSRFTAKSRQVVRNLYINQEIEDLKKRSVNFKAEPITEVSLSGLAAGKVNWRSEDYGVPNTGTLYLAVEDSTLYIISIQDYVERARETMPILDSIVRSFGLKSQPAPLRQIGPEQ